MENSVKVGFATTDISQVDQHFGVAKSFAIYLVNSERSALLEVVQFDSTSMDGEEDKLAPKIAALDGCVAVYSQAAGASAIGQLKKRGIQPIKVSADASVTELLRSLREELRDGPSAWLARAIEAQKPVDPERFERMDAEGWQE